MQCPHCNRMLATVPGVSRVQCFGCGQIVELGSVSAANSKQGRGASGGARNSSSTASKAMIAILSIGLGLVILVGAGTGAFFFLINRKAASNGSGAPTDEVNGVVTQQPSEAAGQTPVQEELVPAYVATDEERALAEQVSVSNRRQIMQMWDQMTATTRKKLLIPKNSFTRNRVEDLMGAIERREIQNMSALLQVEQTEINAVIQVEMADRALQELAAQQGSEASGTN